MTALLSTPRSRGRLWLGLALGAGGLTAVTLGLTAFRTAGTLTNAALLYLLPVVTVAAIGGIWLGLATALASDLLLNWFFVPPYHTLNVERQENSLALLVYVLVGVTVAITVDLAARQRAAAARSAVEARVMARITSAPVAEQSLSQVLGQVRETFGMRTVALLEKGPDGTERVVAAVGDQARIGETPDWRPALSIEAAEDVRMVAEGPELFAEDRRLLGQLATAAARTLEAQRLARRAAHAEQLAEVDRLRTAILAAVGHDLRTPLASIKAAATSLRAPDVAFSPEDSDELLATVEESADRLSDLVENLLAMSRLQAGVLSVQARPVALDEVVASALLSARSAPVRVAVGDDLPLVLADPGLLERVVANLVSNALRAADGDEVAIEAGPGCPGDSDAPETVELRVVDHGPGIPASERDRMFAPFQRLDDHTADGGLGLGLAIARGFTEAMGGRLTPKTTPGGGVTMTVALPAAQRDRA